MKGSHVTPEPHVRSFAFLPPVLRHRNFALFFFSLFVSNTGIWMAQTAQGWLVYDLTGSPALVGVAFGAFGLPMLVLPYFGGILADRLDRRRIMWAMQSAAAIIAFVLAGLVAAGAVQVWHLVLASFLQASVNAFDQPARQALLPALVPEDRLRPAIALNSIVFTGPAFVGPALTGLMVGGLGWSISTAFFANAISFLAVLIALAFMALPPFQPDGSPGSGRDSFMTGIRFAARHRVVMPSLLLLVVAGLFGRSYMALLPVVAEDVLGVGIQGLGLLASAGGVGAIVGAVLLSTEIRLPPNGTLGLAAALAMAILLLIFAFVTSYAAAVILIFALGVATTLMSTAVRTPLQLATPQDLMGRVMSLHTMVVIGLAPVGGFILGPLAEATGTQVALALPALILLVSVAVLAVWKPELRRLQ